MKIGILGMGSIGQRHRLSLKGQRNITECFWHDPFGSVKGIPSLPRQYTIDNSDAVLVCSPSKVHAGDLMDVVDKGKHVFVEKPIGYDSPPLLEGYIMGARSRRHNLIIATGFNLRFHHCVQYAKRALSSLGEVISAHFVVNQRTEKEIYLRDGIIRNWLSHEIDLAHHLLGAGHVTACTAPLDEFGNDSIDAHIQMKFDHVRDTVYISGDYYTEPEQRYFWIKCAKANLYVNLITRECYLQYGTNEPYLVYEAKDSFDANYMDEMKAFIDSVESGVHVAPLATGEDGVSALYTVMDAYSVMKTGKRYPRPDLSDMG